MKKRILALLLAFSMMLSLLPVSALADTGGGIDFAVYASNEPLPDLKIGSNGKPDLSGITPVSPGVYQGNGWEYNTETDTLTILTSHTESFAGMGFNNTLKVNVVVQKGATVERGYFNNTVENHGTMSQAYFYGNVTNTGDGTMKKCTFWDLNITGNLTITNEGEMEGCIVMKDVTMLTNKGKMIRSSIEAETVQGDGTYDTCLLAQGYNIAGVRKVKTKNETDKVAVRLVNDGTQCDAEVEKTEVYFTGTPTLKVRIRRPDDGWIRIPLTNVNGDENYGFTLSGDNFYTFAVPAEGDVILNDTVKHTLTLQFAEIVNDDGTTPISGTYVEGEKIRIRPNFGTDSEKVFDGWMSEDINVNTEIVYDAETNTYILTMPGKNATVAAKYNNTALEIGTDGKPVTENRKPYGNSGVQGNGWKYENDTLTLESGEYDFTHTEPRNTASSRYGDSVKCNIVVEENAEITGGILDGDSLTNSGTVKDILFMGYWLTNNNGTLSCLLGPSVYDNPSFTRHTVTAVDGSQIYYTVNQQSSGNEYQLYFTGTPKFTVMLEDSTIHHINGRTDYGGLKKESNSDYYTFTPPKEEDIVLNDTIIHEPFTMTNGYPTASNGGKTACKGEGWEYILGNPEHGDFLLLSNAQIDFSKISDGSPVECKLFIGYGVAVQGGTFNGDVINNGGILGGTFNGKVINNNGGILGGTFNGAVENHGTIENGVFNGAVTNIAPGTVSNSITGTGTLNGKPITPNAYTLTVTGGGLVNGKTSAVVEAGDEVRLTVGEMQEGMSFNYWDLPTALTKALTDQELTDKDFTFSNKVEPLTFTMPDLSGYTEDTRFTIRLDIRPAELPDDDDGPSVLGTMATVAVGGAAAGILVWQGVSLGVDSYLQLSLPDGVPVPTNRRELVKLLWETAGKPDVVLPALYGDVSTEDGELQKATRWAIDNGLVKPADDSDASRFDPDRSVSKYEVARAWFKVQQMLK